MVMMHGCLYYMHHAGSYYIASRSQAQQGKRALRVAVSVRVRVRVRVRFGFGFGVRVRVKRIKRALRVAVSVREIPACMHGDPHESVRMND